MECCRLAKERGKDRRRKRSLDKVCWDFVYIQGEVVSPWLILEACSSVRVIKMQIREGVLEGGCTSR